MAGVILEVVPKRIFDFGGVALGASEAYTVAERIEISQYTEAALILRIHDTLNVSFNSFSVLVYPDGFTREDPRLQFTGLGVAQPFGQLSSTGTALQTFGFKALGEYLAIGVSAARPDPTPFLPYTLSIALWLRSPDDI